MRMTVAVTVTVPMSKNDDLLPQNTRNNDGDKQQFQKNDCISSDSIFISIKTIQLLLNSLAAWMDGWLECLARML